MYTVKEAADIIGVSKVAMYNHIKRKEVKKHIFTQNKKTYIKPEGVAVIKGLKSQVNVKSKGLTDNVENTTTTSDLTINMYVNDLKEQSTKKDERIKRLEVHIEELTQEKKQITIKAEKDLDYFKGLLQQSLTEKQLLLENQKSWWQKMFKTK